MRKKTSRLSIALWTPVLVKRAYPIESRDILVAREIASSAARRVRAGLDPDYARLAVV